MRPLLACVALVTLSGCVISTPPRQMNAGPTALGFPQNKAIVFINGDRRAENLLFHRSFDQAFQFQLIGAVPAGQDGTPQDQFVIARQFWPYAVVPPGTYVLTALADAPQASAQTYHFDADRTPLRFTVHAGDIADLGKLVAHNDDTDGCNCTALLTLKLEPSDPETKAAIAAMLAARHPALAAATPQTPELLRTNIKFHDDSKVWNYIAD